MGSVKVGFTRYRRPCCKVDWGFIFGAAVGILAALVVIAYHVLRVLWVTG